MSDGAKSKKPANTAFKQQRLRAWQPILTPKTVLPTFFLIGAIFIPLGIGLYIASDKVRELTFDYTECRKPGATPESPITEWSFNEATQDCTITFRVPEFFNPPVFMYYRLTNFYQNHRRYVKSFSANQLKGDIIGPGDKNMATCDPLKSPPAGTLVGGSKEAVAASAQYYPCGLIANSMYSDEISGLTCVDASGAACAGQTTYEFSEQGISWPTDKDRFKQTKFLETLTTPEVLATTLIPPPLWQKAWPKWQDGYNSTNFPNINTWERFQVWMRTAALPTFRKLWGRNMDTTLSPGTWTITIHDTFDVNKFSGTKSIVISTVSLLGGKNPFLGAAYITVGVICWVLGLAFLFRHMIKPRKLGDHTYLSWNQPQAAPQARAPEVLVSL
ncbi:CDC50/LEM3 family [Powellomyces hirtus]|nr:CDC50/LEM3 family [Powellomyces hirtus]